MSAILNSLNAHDFLIFQPILMTQVSKSMVYRALSDKAYLLLGLRSVRVKYYVFRIRRLVDKMADYLGTMFCFPFIDTHVNVCRRPIWIPLL